MMFKKYGMYLILLLLFVGAVSMIYVKLNPQSLPKNLVAGTGKMDGDIIALNTKYPARVKSINVHEGDLVHKGEVIAVLDSAEFEAKKAAVAAEIAAAKSQRDALREEYLMTKEALPVDVLKAQNGVLISKSKKRALQDTLQTLREVAKQKKRDLKRVETLYDKKLIAKQKLEYAKLAYADAKNKLASLKQQLQALNQNMEIANHLLKEANIQLKKIQLLKAKLDAATKEIKALQEKKRVVEIAMDDLTIKSPINGVVLEKVANVGEVIGAGMVVVTLIDPNSLYLKMFVDTMENGKIHLGDKGVIFLDANPDKAIEAEVVRVAAQAEFTPKEVSVRSDRIQRVYALHLKPLHAVKNLKLGLPAVGVITTNGKGLPKSLDDIPEI